MPYPPDYGTFTITRAIQLTQLSWTPGKLRSVNVAKASDGNGNDPVLMKRAFDGVAGDVYGGGIGKRIRIGAVHAAPPPGPPPLPPVVPAPPPPPPLPNVSCVGVMDVGAAGCNLLFDNTLPNALPLTYFDVGSPMNVNVGSMIPTLRGGPANPAWLGPIMPAAGAPINAVLSHWHWDHWRLAHIAGLLVPWVDPPQPIGPMAGAFQVALGLLRAPYGGAPFTVFGNYTVYQCAPPPAGLPAAALMDNTGLAFSFVTRLPMVDVVPHMVVLTGDANFDSVGVLQAAGYPNLTGIGAVHHGSNQHGAANNLPAVLAMYAGQGKIAYSNGVRLTGAGAWVHCYGHPNAAAVGNYVAGGWGAPLAPVPPAPNYHRSTSEGLLLNGPLPPAAGARGNIAMGTPPVLGAPYAATAFGAFPNQLI